MPIRTRMRRSCKTTRSGSEQGSPREYVSCKSVSPFELMAPLYYDEQEKSRVFSTKSCVQFLNISNVMEIFEFDKYKIVCYTVSVLY